MKVRPKLSEREYEALYNVVKEAERLGVTLGRGGPRARAMARLDDAWSEYAKAQVSKIGEGMKRGRPLPQLVPLVGGAAATGEGMRE